MCSAVRTSVDWSLITAAIANANDSMLAECLLTLHNFGHALDGLKDAKDFTLLHHAVLKGTPGKLQFIIETVHRTEKLDPESLK